MKIIFLFFAFLLSFNPFGFAQPAADLSKVDNQFAFDLYSHLASNKGNIFFSPYSLSSALGMAYEGAQGETAQEIGKVLYGNDEAAARSESMAFIQDTNLPNKSYELSVANAVWAPKTFPFKENYLNTVKTAYFAQASNLDFASNPEASRVTINNWVSDNTKERINDLLPAGSITPGTSLILTDAVYFKDKWETPFKKENTKPDNFWLSPDQSVQTDMMTLRGGSFGYTDNDQAQILMLPYQGRDLTMTIVLPRSKDIQSLEKIFTSQMLWQWEEGKIMLQNVNVFLPKFKFETSYEMSDILAGMGMKLAFDPKKADFSGMVNLPTDGHLWIGNVFHKAYIDTNEEGTEAAAATGVAVEGFALRSEPQPKEFRADHPFIFMIQDNVSGKILFMGRVSDPRQK